jgi:hypothetical protein
MPGGDVHVIRPFEASPDRAALLMDGIPGYARLRKVDGRWKVDTAPLIEERKAGAPPVR